MNNLQLSLLLEQYHDRLRRAIDALADALPEGLSEKRKRTLMPGTFTFFPCLTEIADLCDSIGSAVEKLRAPSDDHAV